MLLKQLMKGLIVFQVFPPEVFQQKEKWKKTQTLNRPKAKLLSNLRGMRRVLERITATRVGYSIHWGAL